MIGGWIGPLRAPVVVALLILPACGGESGVSAGLPPRLERLRVDTLFAIGAQSGEPWETFGGIWDVATAPDGRFAVLDVDAVAVHLFDGAGAPLGSIADQGLDPGTLRSPTGIAWNGGDELRVWDPGSSWISRFSVGPSGAEFVDRHRAFAFGETGFCTSEGRVFLSYFQDGQVIHEIGGDGAIVRSFSPAPDVAGMETLVLELQELALEELTPSKLLCVSGGVLEASYFQSRIQFHDTEGRLVWSRELADFTPVLAYSPDDMGVGLQYAEGDGSHLLRSVVPWGDGRALLQHELRVEGSRPDGAADPIESRLIRLEDGAEEARTRSLPLILGTRGNRVFEVRQRPVPQVLVLEVTGDG
ncbi:MAG: hypothetical protein WEG36_10365 [Gemmatimonadota bacterium]